MERTDLVCFCMNVTYGDVLDAIKSGAKTVAEVTDKTDAGSMCGACKPRITKILDEQK